MLTRRPKLSYALPILGLTATLVACAATVPKQQYDDLSATNEVNVIELADKTKALVESTDKLHAMRNTLEEQSRRLTRICTEYPEHIVCRPQTAATFAREAF